MIENIDVFISVWDQTTQIFGKTSFVCQGRIYGISNTLSSPFYTDIYHMELPPCSCLSDFSWVGLATLATVSVSQTLGPCSIGGNWKVGLVYFLGDFCILLSLQI